MNIGSKLIAEINGTLLEPTYIRTNPAEMFETELSKVDGIIYIHTKIHHTMCHLNGKFTKLVRPQYVWSVNFFQTVIKVAINGRISVITVSNH